ncbi:MAG TPA: acid phosphatase [Magnetospirillaceae bacterium]|jgi:phospholipase C
MRSFRALTAALLASSAFAIHPAAAAEPKALRKIDHILVIYLENHSFDNMFGLFPGAEGLRSKAAKAALPQVDKDGKPYTVLPPVMNTGLKQMVPDTRFPNNLANKPFGIDQYVPEDQKTFDLVHKFYQNQAQIDGGKNDKFAQLSDAQGLVMGYYNTQHTKLWRYARDYTLADHYFMGAFGGSFLNHQWTICACTPVFPNAPDKAKAHVDAAGTVVIGPDGRMVGDGMVTPDGFAVNTIMSVYQPHPAGADPAIALPPQTAPTIGDRMSAKGLSWAWYSGGWNDALAGDQAKMKSDAFQFHHQPFAYFEKYGDGTPGRAEHLKDEVDLRADIGNGKLPALAFFKPVGVKNQHPGYADVSSGDAHAAEIIEAVRKSPLWKSTVIIVTYDENGGFWDHVAPPDKNHGGDRWGPGTRIPAIIISPFAKKHFVDHTVYDTTAILRLAEERFGLEPLGGERKFPGSPNDLRNAFVGSK